MPDLLQDTFAPVFPFEHPTWTVAVHLSGGVLVAQNIIAHHREDTYTENEFKKKGNELSYSIVRDICKWI